MSMPAQRSDLAPKNRPVHFDPPEDVCRRAPRDELVARAEERLRG